MLKIYGIKTCDSVRKALKYLKSKEIAYEFIDFKQTSVTKEEIADWLTKTDIDTLFNKRGTTYRTLKLKELTLSNEDKQDWLFKENMLIKRPVITFDNDIIVGYNHLEDKINNYINLKG